MDSLEHCRDRTLMFEAEYQESIDKIASMEEYMNTLSELRKTWLQGGISTENLEFELFKRKIEAIEKRGEILKLDIMLDNINLESFYETQQLRQLVAGTKPQDRDDVDGKRRDMEMHDLMREGVEVIKNALTNSVSQRQRINSQLERLCSELDMRVQEHALHKVKRLDAYHHNLSDFSERVQVEVADSDERLKSLLSEYLVLRHNARIVMELTTRQQNALLRRRSELQNKYDTAKNDAAEKFATQEREYSSMMEAKLRQFRSDVIQSEHALDEKYAQFTGSREHLKNSIKEMKLKYKNVQQKYISLQNQRRNEIVTVNGELKHLRDVVASTEKTFLRPQISVLRDRGQMNSYSEMDEIANLRNRLGHLKLIMEDM